MTNRDRTTAAVILSRQALRPCRSCEWVCLAEEAVKWLGLQGFGLVTSIGLQTWELLLTLAVEYRVPTTVVLPAGGAGFSVLAAWTTGQFDLADREVELVPLEDSGFGERGRPPAERRDAEVSVRADLLLPVSVRSGGGMDDLIYQAEISGRPVDRRFAVPYGNGGTTVAYELDRSMLSDSVRRIGREYLTHWTRASNGPWPTERSVDYYRDLLRADRYPRGALATLLNIAGSGRVVASRRHMPRETPAVCFSGLSPAEVAPLVRWRARYRCMSFEPYGIGIERGYAESIGIRPVVYCEKGASGGDTDTPFWLRQSAGSVGDWRREDEYRHREDLILADVPKDKLICFCRYRAEVPLIQKRTGIRTVPFLEGGAT